MQHATVHADHSRETGECIHCNVLNPVVVQHPVSHGVTMPSSATVTPGGEAQAYKVVNDGKPANALAASVAIWFASSTLCTR